MMEDINFLISNLDVKSLTSNEFLVAGLILGVLGISTKLIMKVTSSLKVVLTRLFITGVKLDSKSSTYDEFTEEINRLGLLKNSRRVAIRNDELSPGSEKLILYPKPGVHYMFYNWNIIRLESTIEDKIRITDQFGRTNPLETYDITLYGFSNKKHIVKDMIANQKRLNSEKLKKPIVFMAERDFWCRSSELRERKLNTICVNDNIHHDILKDMSEFYDSEKWYEDRGIPWQRGYMLHGPPGTGKTSMIKALAYHLSKDVRLVNLSDWRLTDSNLKSLMINADRNSIVVFEDIDAMNHTFGKSRKLDNDEDSNIDEEESSRETNDGMGVSLSGLLNAIDGIEGRHGSCLFMTTNNISTIDAALLRNGRVDVTQKLDKINGEPVLRMFNNFFPDDKISLNHIDIQKKFNPSTLQGKFFKLKDDPDQALSLISVPENRSNG